MLNKYFQASIAIVVVRFIFQYLLKYLNKYDSAARNKYLSKCRNIVGNVRSPTNTGN